MGVCLTAEFLYVRDRHALYILHSGLERRGCSRILVMIFFGFLSELGDGRGHVLTEGCQ